MALAGLHAEQVRVLELDEQPRALAEVAPHRVVDDVERRGAPRPQHAAPAASFRMKHSSLLRIFSPMHTASEKRFAMERGSRPCKDKRSTVADASG